MPIRTTVLGRIGDIDPYAAGRAASLAGAQSNDPYAATRGGSLQSVSVNGIRYTTMPSRLAAGLGDLVAVIESP